MNDPLARLEMRRRQLLVHSARLRADLGADHQVIVEAISNVDRMVDRVRGLLSLASPLALAGGGALLLRFFRRRSRPGRRASRGIRWLTLARRALTLLSIVRAVARARAQRHAEPQP